MFSVESSWEIILTYLDINPPDLFRLESLLSSEVRELALDRAGEGALGVAPGGVSSLSTGILYPGRSQGQTSSVICRIRPSIFGGPDN